MSGEIHPIFSHVPYRQVAEAFSEFLLRPDDVKVNVNNGIDETTPFPPVPAYVAAIASAYIETTPNGWAVRRQVLIADPDQSKHADVSAEYLEAYRAGVGKFHELAKSFQSSGVFNVGNLALRTIEMAEEAKMRTVATFVMCRAIESSEIFSGLVIPKRTFLNIPLEYRNQLLEFLSSLPPEARAEFESTDGSKAFIQSILQNNPAEAELAFFGASLSLPPVPLLDETLISLVNQQLANKTKPPMDRKARRKQAIQDRRNKHREN